MNKTFRIVLIAGIVLALAGGAAAEEAFVLGVAPHTSARFILEMYHPVRVALEKALKAPVDIVTAPDFTEFARRALAQQYDLAVTTGHQARLLQVDGKYIPLLVYKAGFKAVALVAANSPIKNPKDLKGKNVLGLSASSLVTLWGQHWLAENGLGSIRVKYVSASDSVAHLIISGEAAAGFTSLANFQDLKPEVRSQLRFLAESKELAGRTYVLNARQAAKRKTIETALFEFAKTPEGKRYFETHKLEGYRKLKPNELESMDPYADEVRKTLGKADK